MLLFVRKLLILVLLGLGGCSPVSLNNSGDPNTLDFLLSAILRNLRFVSTFSYDTKIVGETGVNASSFSDPPRSDLSNCLPVSSLPEGFVVDPAGKVRQTGKPTTTLAPTLFKIQCGTSAYATLALGEVSIEVKGLDWVKNLTNTGSGNDTSISDLAPYKNESIYFLATYINNGTNVAADFGTTVTTQSYPLATNQSPAIIKLSNAGQFESLRVLGGDQTKKIEVDDEGNQYVAASFSQTSTVNPDPAFNQTAINKTAAIVGGTNFLLMRVNKDNTFGFARTMTASTLTDSTSLCYSKTNDRLYVSGKANGTGIDLGIDFSVNDTSGTATGFILEISKTAQYFGSKKFSGSTHEMRGIKCRSDGSYSFATFQVANALDYGTPYGTSDNKTPNNLGSAMTKINSNGSYGFTRIFFGGGTNLPPVSIDTDKDGNSVIGFNGNQTTVDVRIGVDGISDNKTSAGSGDMYVVKVGSDGSYQWGKRIGGFSNDSLNSIAVRPSDGNVFVLGAYGNGNSGAMTLFADLGSSLSITKSTTDGNPFLVELSGSTGNFVRYIPIGISSINLYLQSMKFDSDENLYIGGSFRAQSTFRYSNEGKSITKEFTYGNTQQAIFIKIRP